MSLTRILSGVCLIALVAGPAAAQRGGGGGFHGGGGGFHGGFAHPGFVGRPFIHPGFVHGGPRFFFRFGGPVVIAPPYRYPYYPYAYPYPYPPAPYPYYPPY
jgi:hypothetical protein